MNVDRAKFLLLTTALSAATVVAATASGCTVKSVDNGTSGTVTPPTPTDDGGVDAYAADAYVADGYAPDGGACLDDTGAAPSCAGAPTDCATACAHYLTNYTNGVGRAIADCIVKLPTCESATTQISACVQGALALACPDPTAEAFCEPISTSCGTDAGVAAFDKTECSDLAKGLNATGRTALSSCVTEGMAAGYCKPNPSTCLDTIE